MGFPKVSNHCHRFHNSRQINPRRLLLSTLLLLAVVVTQDDDDDATSSADQFSEPFIDQITRLQMERFFGARTSFGFAFALPESQPVAGRPASFLGQLSFPLVDGQGWGSFGLTGSMEGNFILAAWPDGNGGVMASFRQATDEDNPPKVAGDFRVRLLPDGVSANSASLLYTFFCENCLDNTLGLGLEATAGDAVMGWALSERPPRGDPADPGAVLDFHERGFGPFTARLGQAKAVGFEAVAATALEPVQDSGNAVAAVPGAFEDDSGGEASGDEGEGGNAELSGDESGDDDD